MNAATGPRIPAGIVPGASLAARPWPNGLGTTRDIAGAAAPDGGAGWLCSVADLAGDAPFSHFSDTDRIFTLVEGAGLTLVVDGVPLPVPPLVPVRFPGDRPTASRMDRGPGRAFNLFLRRGLFRTAVSAALLAPGEEITTAGRVAIAWCVSGAVLCPDGRAEAGDAWVGEAGTTLRAPDAEPAMLVLAAIDAV